MCVHKCPDHWKPVCGSDGTSYSNHCSLHKTACVSGTPISPLHPGFCRKDRITLLTREEFTEERPDSVPALLPTACFENDRNRLREFLINWFQLMAPKQPWFSHGMSYAEELWGHFFSMDHNEDKFLDSREVLDYLNRNKTGGRHQQKNDQMRQLCLDALVEEGDKNFDWRLSFGEYKQILAESYTPSAKLCRLNGRMYEDGAETSVECNGCVCACGKWICTSQKCPEGYTNMADISSDVNQENLLQTVEYEDYSVDYDDHYDDDDNDYDYSPEDDPDVQDINWF